MIYPTFLISDSRGTNLPTVGWYRLAKTDAIWADHSNIADVGDTQAMHRTSAELHIFE
jgi:hypothetical protein